jgi:hypothetical protein
MTFLKTTPIYIEFGQETVKILDGTSFVELAIERDSAAQLTSACAQELAAHLKRVAGQGLFARRRAFCAIGARGVSLRRVPAPPKRENYQQLLTMQVEREFPLGPDELAWGVYGNGNGNGNSPSSSPVPAMGEASVPQATALTVVAIKRDAIEGYARLLAACGLDATFTVGILAIPSVCSQPPRSYAVLDIRRRHSELAVFEQGHPAALRILPVGDEDFSQALSQSPGSSRGQTGEIHRDGAPTQPEPDAVLAAIQPVVAALAAAIRTIWTGHKLYLAHGTTRVNDLPGILARALGDRVECEQVGIPQGESATLHGLRNWFGNGRRQPPLIIRGAGRDHGAARAMKPARWKWAAAAGLLLLCLVALRYAEPALRGSALSKRLAEIKAHTTNNPEIESELSFLQFLETNRPPYLDVLATVGDAAAPGTRVEALTMNRRGELSFRGTMQSPQEATQLRAKLVESGRFSRVVLDEQTPTQDNRIQVRITARWLAPSERPPSSTRESGIQPLTNS